MSGRNLAETKATHPSGGVLTLQPASEWYPAEGGGVMHLAKGSGYWISATGCLMLETGDVLLIVGAASGKLRVSRLAPARVHFMPVSAGDFASIFRNEQAAQFDRLWSAGSQKTWHLPAPSPAAAEFRGMSQARGRAKRPKAVHMRMLQWLSRQIDPNCELELVVRPREEAAGGRGRLSTWLATFEREELSSLSVVELAKRYGCSSRHLSRLFHREFGLSVRQRQISLRMEIARELLRNDRLRIIEVALGCGYRNLGLFNAAFKTAHGMTPSQWRRKASLAPPPAPSLPWPPAATNRTPAMPSLNPVVTPGSGACYAPL